MSGKKLLPVLTLLALLVSLVGNNIYATGNPTVTKFDVVPDKPGYSLGATPAIIVTITYENFNSTSVRIEIYNSSNKVQEITGIVLDGNGTYQQTHNMLVNISEPGSYDYEAKIVDVNTGYVLATDSFTLNFYERQMTITVSWSDASGDRKIDLNEEIQVKIFITWSFWNTSETLNVFVIVDSGNEVPLGTIAVSSEAGSTELQYSMAFETEGKHIIRVVVDANNNVISEKTIGVYVGSMHGALEGLNWEYVVVFIIIIIAVLVSLYIFRKS